MSTTAVEPLIDPTELESFGEAEALVRRVREVADRIPAELDEQSAATAADTLKEIGHALKDIDLSRKVEKEPYTITGRRIDADYKEVGASLEAAQSSLRDRVLTYNRAVQKAAKEEADRQEKNARERQKREDEKAAKEQRASRDKRGAPPPPPPPTGARGGFAKSSVKKVKKYRIEDESLLPDHLVKRVPDKLKIKAAVNAGEAIPGVRMWEEEEVATR